MAKASPEMLVITKVYDLVLWSCERVAKFPRSHRFTLGDRIERRYGSFHRRFALPDAADPEGVTASGHNGVLEISIPKRPETTPRRIQVGGASTAGTRQ